MTDGKLISIYELVNRARERGFEFGSGAPANRIRYWSSSGLIAHAKRQRIQKGSLLTIGYYPEETVERLIVIQNLQKGGLSVAKIKAHLTKHQAAISTVRCSELREKDHDKQLISLAEVTSRAAALGFVFGNGLPENRIHYWSSIGLLPHAVRRRVGSGQARNQAFYPRGVVQRLVRIQELQNQGFSLDQVRQQIDLSGVSVPELKQRPSNAGEIGGERLDLPVPEKASEPRAETNINKSFWPSRKMVMAIGMASVFWSVFGLVGSAYFAFNLVILKQNIVTYNPRVIGKDKAVSTSWDKNEAKSEPKISLNVLGESTRRDLDNSKALVGQAEVPVGSTNIIVQTNALTPQSRIFVSVVGEPVAVAAQAIGDNKFEIKIASPQSAPVTVNWWVAN